MHPSNRNPYSIDSSARSSRDCGPWQSWVDYEFNFVLTLGASSRNLLVTGPIPPRNPQPHTKPHFRDLLAWLPATGGIEPNEATSRASPELPGHRPR
jgi:hypothetical protein